MALFPLENRDFLGFRMIFKVPLNQIFLNFNTMLWIKIWNAGVFVITRSTFSSVDIGGVVNNHCLNFVFINKTTIDFISF
jgi:hypothetical protein